MIYRDFSEGRNYEYKDGILYQLTENMKIPVGLTLSIGELQNLQQFLYDVGYISYEFHMPIHMLSHKIDAFLKQNELAKRSSETT